MPQREKLISALVAAILLVIQSVMPAVVSVALAADNYPTRPIVLVIPLPPAAIPTSWREPLPIR